MNLAFSFAIILHRVYDSLPPESGALFYTDGRRLSPYAKAGGLYVFVDEPEQTVAINCGGFQREEIFAKSGQTYHVFLYPNCLYNPPIGWVVQPVKLLPNAIDFQPDDRFTVRVLGSSFAAGTIRLRSKPHFIGGALRLRCGEITRTVLIIGKEAPYLYYLTDFSGVDFGGAPTIDKVEKGYVARGDALGNGTMVLRENS